MDRSRCPWNIWDISLSAKPTNSVPFVPQQVFIRILGNFIFHDTVPVLVSVNILLKALLPKSCLTLQIYTHNSSVSFSLKTSCGSLQKALFFPINKLLHHLFKQACTISANHLIFVQVSTSVLLKFTSMVRRSVSHMGLMFYLTCLGPPFNY